MAVIQFADYAKTKTGKNNPRPVKNAIAIHDLTAKLEKVLDNCDEIKRCNHSLFDYLVKHGERGRTVRFGNIDTDPRILFKIIDFFVNKNFIEVESVLNQLKPGESRVGNHL